MKSFHFSAWVTGTLVLVSLSACAPRIDQRGKVPEPEKLAQVKPGMHTKEDVLRLIGSPTNTGAFDDNNWLYIHKTTETISFWEPKILNEEIVIIRFDRQGLVEEIRHQDGQGKNIEPVKHVTPAAGEEPSQLQKIFGHFGRFSKKGKNE